MFEVYKDLYFCKPSNTVSSQVSIPFRLASLEEASLPLGPEYEADTNVGTFGSRFVRALLTCKGSKGLKHVDPRMLRLKGANQARRFWTCRLHENLWLQLSVSIAMSFSVEASLSSLVKVLCLCGVPDPLPLLTSACQARLILRSKTKKQRFHLLLLNASPLTSQPLEDGIPWGFHHFAS